MSYASTFVLLFVVATLVALVARRLRVPYTVALVAAGLALGATHAVDAPPLTKELLFAVFLPGLVFEATFHIDVDEFRRDWVTLVSLAVPGVIAAMALIALTLGPAMRAFGAPEGAHVDWRAALLFAALISATDPVAVVALFRTLAAPRRLLLLVEGESLLNDGTAIIFFTIALTAGAARPLLSPSLVTDFLYVAGVGVVVGAGVGAAVSRFIRRVDDAMIEIMLTTIAAYGSFVAAEGVHASGVIATVTAGMLCGRHAARGALSPSARVAGAAFWEYVTFALNSIVFLLIGLVVHVPTLLRAWRPVLAAFVVVTVGRALVTALLAASLAASLPRRLRIPPRWTAILSWGGLRGALSMVLALSIPDGVPQRALFVTITFGVVVLSILVQGLTVGPALRWLGISPAPDDRGMTDERRTVSE